MNQSPTSFEVDKYGETEMAKSTFIDQSVFSLQFHFDQNYPDLNDCYVKKVCFHTNGNKSA